MVHDKLIIQGAREHNLKDVSLELPRDSMIVFTGLSGSGKSSSPSIRFRRGTAPLRGIPVLLRAPSSSGRWTSPTWTSSKACRPPCPSIRSRRRATRARPSARSRRSTTTCACSTPEPARHTACVRRADSGTDAAADRRPRAYHGGRHALPGPLPVVRGRKGEYQTSSTSFAPRLHPRDHRRGGSAPRERPEAGEET